VLSPHWHGLLCRRLKHRGRRSGIIKEGSSDERKRVASSLWSAGFPGKGMVLHHRRIQRCESRPNVSPRRIAQLSKLQGEGCQAVRKVNLGSTIATGSICEANFYDLVKKQDRSQMPVLAAVRGGGAGLEHRLRCRPITARQRLDERDPSHSRRESTRLVGQYDESAGSGNQFCPRSTGRSRQRMAFPAASLILRSIRCSRSCARTTAELLV
jgi:hypothetical protein